MYLLEVKIKKCTSTIKLISENQIFFKNEKEDAAYQTNQIKSIERTTPKLYSVSFKQSSTDSCK